MSKWVNAVSTLVIRQSCSFDDVGMSIISARCSDVMDAGIKAPNALTITSSNAEARRVFAPLPRSLEELLPEAWVVLEGLLPGETKTCVVTRAGSPGTLRVLPPRSQLESEADMAVNEGNADTFVAAWRVKRRNSQKLVVTLALCPLSDQVHAVLLSSVGHLLPTDALLDMAGGAAPSERAKCTFATIMFVDVCNFTTMAGDVGSNEVFAFLARLFARMDACARKQPHTLAYETDGDCWVGVAGVSVRDVSSDTFKLRTSSDLATRCAHATAVFALARDIVEHTRDEKMPDGQPVLFRIGIHSGVVCAGMVGLHIKIAGDAMNTAQRVQSVCPVNAIAMSKETMALLPEDLLATGRAMSAVAKGKGHMDIIVFDTGVDPPLCGVHGRSHRIGSVVKSRSESVIRTDGVFKETQNPNMPVVRSVDPADPAYPGRARSTRAMGWGATGQALTGQAMSTRAMGWSATRNR